MTTDTRTPISPSTASPQEIGEALSQLSVIELCELMRELAHKWDLGEKVPGIWFASALPVPASPTTK